MLAAMLCQYFIKWKVRIWNVDLLDDTRPLYNMICEVNYKKCSLPAATIPRPFLREIIKKNAYFLSYDEHY